MLKTGRKSKQTKAHEISRKTKEIVFERQKGKSIFPPYRNITVDMCCCHYIPRSRGGLGKEWNVFGCYQTAWCDEHKAFDHQLSEKQIKEITTLTSDELVTVARNHFIENYENWNEENCRYKPYVEDYGVRRKK